MKIENLSDETLFQICKSYGEKARFWRQKFIGLLPEVYKRKLYEKKKFGSIFEFAKKLAGLSEEQVRLTLNLEKRFEKLPELKSLLVNGEVSINKLTRVVSIASSENQEFLAENLKNLSQSAVETLVRDEKLVRKSEIENIDYRNQSGLFEAEIEEKSLRAQEARAERVPVVCISELSLSTEVYAKLLELQQKGIDLNQLLLEFLQKRETDIAQRKEQIREQILQKEAVLQKQNKEPSRNIPKAAEKILQEEFGTRCAINGCNKPATETHHLLSFAVGKTHDPKLLIRLCKCHHELQHAVNLNYQKIRKGLTNIAF